MIRGRIHAGVNSPLSHFEVALRRLLQYTYMTAARAIAIRFGNGKE